MATLEKIRSKSVLLVVIIAVALLAFILGDAITNGRNLFGNNTTVAKVGNEKIEIQEYQQKHQELAQQLEDARRQNPEQYANFDTQTLSQQALEQLIAEKLVNNAVSSVGITTTPELLRYYMIEDPRYMIPEMQSLLQALQSNGLPVRTPEEAYTLIFSPQNYNLTQEQVRPFQEIWVGLENRYGQLIGQVVYANLLQNSFKANDLDVAAMKRDYVASANVKVAKKPYGELDEKKYKVTDEDIKKAYNDQKELYAVDELTKEISFIEVSVMPSAKDNQEALQLRETVIAELRAGDVKKETRKAGLDVQRLEMRSTDVRNAMLKTFLETAPSDSIMIVNDRQGFQLAKLLNRTMAVDSVEVATIAVQGSKGLVEQVLAYVNGGNPADSIVNKFSADSVAYQAPQWQALYSASGNMPKNLGLEESVYDSLYNNNGSYMVINEQEGVALIAAITKKSSPKQIVEYETVDYILHPSDATLAEARQKLQKFIDTNNTAAKFTANAAKNQYNPVDIELTQSTPAVPMQFGGFYPDSRSLVRWVMIDGKDGEVSKIYQSKDAAAPKLYVAAIIDSYEDYVPWDNTKVKEALTAQVRRDKAGDAMVAQYKKSGNVEAAAKAMGVEATDIESLQSTKRDMTVTDNKVKGRILGSKPSKTMQVVKGDDGVYAFIINANTNEKVEMTDEQFANMFLQLHRVDPTLILRGKQKVQNNIYKFEQGE